MYFLNSLLGSFFRTIGRILAYLLIGMAILLVINEVKAETIDPISLSIFAPNARYNGQCVGDACDASAIVGTGNVEVNRDLLPTNANLYFGNVENPGEDKLYLRGSFYIYGQFSDIEYFNLMITKIQVHMLDIDSFVNDNACSVSSQDVTIAGTNFQTKLYTYSCEWSASSTHNYELVIWHRVPTAYEFVRNINYQVNGVLTNDKDLNNTIQNSTSQIIINQNQNSENIINNQNQNQQQTNQGLENIDKTNKSILQNIIDLPKNIINGFFDMLKSLFIPSDNFFNDKFNDIRENAESKLGILGYPFILVIDTLEYFLTIEDTGQYIITWPDINVPNFENLPPIIEAGSFDLSSVLEKPSIQMAHDLYFTFVNALLILAFLKLCHNTYVSVFGGEYDNTEYITTADETWYDNETGEASGMSKHIEKRTKVVRN